MPKSASATTDTQSTDSFLAFNEPLQWHAAAWQHLLRLQQQQRLPHALLLTGASGIGKLQFARAFAAYLLCDKPQTYACGHCKGCRLAEQGSHPDHVELMPEERGREIKVDQVRELSGFVVAAAQQGGYRVVIIQPPEDMNSNAANALLKSLEEPGDKTVFMLVSDHPGRLMPTIKSRCQTLPLAMPDQQQALAWLQQYTAAEQAELLLNLAAGAPLQALEFLGSDVQAERELLLNSLKAAVSGRMSIPEIARKWQQQDALRLLGWLASLVDDLIRWQLTADPQALINLDAQRMLEKAAVRTSQQQAFAFADKIQDYRQKLLAKANLNKQLMLEDVLIAWVKLLG